MTKHNKKRNVGIIYELFLKHIGNCLIDNKMDKLTIATKILEKRFAKNTELYKEFRLFNALAQSTISDTHIVASILTEAKSAARNFNLKKLEREKSLLIKDINYNIKDKKFYYRNISNYKDLATIQLTINEWRKKEADLKLLIEYEKKVGECLLRDKNTISLKEEKLNLDASSSNFLVEKIMTEKINNKYKNFSLEEKRIIQNYAILKSNPSKLKKYFLDKKTNVLNILENFELNEENKILIEKVDLVRKKINSINLKNKEVDDSLVVKFLTLTKLINEIKNENKT